MTPRGHGHGQGKSQESGHELNALKLKRESYDKMHEAHNVRGLVEGSKRGRRGLVEGSKKREEKVTR